MIARPGDASSRRGAAGPPVPALLLAALPLAGGCGAPDRVVPPTPAAGVVAEPWPAAARLFRSDPDWRGGDAAYAIRLDRERTLWLFGDSFVARTPGATQRGGCAMVRNSIGLQTGVDPASATMEFAWRRDGSGPTDWLPPDGERWHWPLHGLRLGNDVILFCTRVERTGASGPFGFRAVGWTAFKIAGVDGPLAHWRAEPLPTPSSKFPVVVGTGVVDRGEHVYAFALREPGDHALLLLRWPRAAVARGDLLAPEWWDLGGWRPHAQMHAAPTAVLGEAAPEFTVFAVAGGYAMVQSLGFGSSDLAVRTAPALTGPWSAAASVLHPPESDRQGVFTYAGKGLPLEGGTVLATYASNAWDFGELVRDERLYYPHCVRLSFSGGSTR